MYRTKWWGAVRGRVRKRASSSFSAFSHLGVVRVCVCVPMCVCVCVIRDPSLPSSKMLLENQSALIAALWQNPETVSTCCHRDFYRPIKWELKAITGRSGCSSSACSQKIIKWNLPNWYFQSVYHASCTVQKRKETRLAYSDQVTCVDTYVGSHNHPNTHTHTHTHR